MKITLDTNILPADGLLAECKKPEWEFSVITVTEREVENTEIQVSISPLGIVPETMVWDETTWGNGVWGSEDNATDLEYILTIISHGSFPQKRDTLSSGERRQLRDAMIFQAHVREQRDIFVRCFQTFSATRSLITSSGFK
jgi:hypothetical protein